MYAKPICYWITISFFTKYLAGYNLANNLCDIDDEDSTK